MGVVLALRGRVHPHRHVEADLFAICPGCRRLGDLGIGQTVGKVNGLHGIALGSVQAQGVGALPFGKLKGKNAHADQVGAMNALEAFRKGLIALVLCTSTYAILLCAILLMLYLALMMQYRGVTRRAIVCFMALFIAGAAALYLFRNSILSGYFVRKLTTVGSTSRTSFIWQEEGLFSVLQNVLGVGVGNEETYYAYLRNDTLGYMNSISLMFLYSGTFGVVLMVLFYVKAWAGLRNHSRVVLLLLAAMSLFSTAFVSPMMTLYTVVIAAGDSVSSWCDDKERELQN